MANISDQPEWTEKTDNEMKIQWLRKIIGQTIDLLQAGHHPGEVAADLTDILYATDGTERGF